MKSLANISIRPLRNSGPHGLTSRQTQAVFRTVYRITGNHEDAEDAMQDAFMQALRHSEDFAGRAAFSTWFTRIAINSALMILRKRRNSRTVPLDVLTDSEAASVFQETTDPAPDVEQRYLQKERETTVRAAISELRPSFRSVVELRFLGERPMREVAQIIDVSLCAAKSRLFHAREALLKSRRLRRIRSGQPARNELAVPVFRSNPRNGRKPKLT